jgi:RNAse (barnase) inhibitor barstar
MKSLTALLQDRKHGGVYRLESAPPLKEMEKQAKNAGYAFFDIEGQKIQKKEQFLNHAALSMRFPEHFGNNWDAFEDCLTDLSWIAEDNDVAGYVILFDHCDHFAQASPNHFETLIEIFRSAVEYWHGQGRAMFILLHGKAGEEWDLKAL